MYLCTKCTLFCLGPCNSMCDLCRSISITWAVGRNVPSKNPPRINKFESQFKQDPQVINEIWETLPYDTFIGVQLLIDRTYIFSTMVDNTNLFHKEVGLNTPARSEWNALVSPPLQHL